MSKFTIWMIGVFTFLTLAGIAVLILNPPMIICQIVLALYVLASLIALIKICRR